MKSLIILYLIMISLAAGGCFPGGNKHLIKNQRQRSTQEKDNPYLYDFGKVKTGTILKHTFFLKNESNKSLKILRVSSSCGCTTPKLNKDVLAPGELVPLEVSFNTKGYLGSVQQYVYVSTDSLDKGLIRYIIKAKIIK